MTVSDAELRMAEPTPASRRLQLARHEAAHAVVTRLYGIEIERATIVADRDVSGSVAPIGADLTVSAIVQDAQVKDDCLIVLAIMPEHGESRASAHKWLGHAFEQTVILVSGAEGELLSGLVPHFDYHDRICAIAYAKTLAMHRDSIDPWIEIAREEASNLLRQYWSVVCAIADRLLEAGTLDGQEIDEIIMAALADAAREDSVAMREYQRGFSSQ